MPNVMLHKLNKVCCVRVSISFFVFVFCYSSPVGVYGSPMNRTYGNYEIWHIYWGGPE